jgi:transcriptional regulator with XRE-family HTH domain
MALKLSGLQTHDEVLAEELRDPEFRAEWERLTLARAVGQCVLQYRAQHALSQRDLAKLLGIKQPQVARLEAGTHDPSFQTLRLLADRLGMEFLVAVSPRRGQARWVKSRPRAAKVFEDAELSSGTRVAVAAR